MTTTSRKPQWGPPRRPPLLPLRSLVLLVVALLVGLGAGYLTFRVTADPAAAVLAGGASAWTALERLDKWVH